MSAIWKLGTALLFFQVLFAQKPNEMAHKYTNALINETSPYLLQHAHNPVNWEAWSPEVLLRAKKENKLLLISIGYAACHWCHVMEHECFEDETVAQVMNDNFINIKIDREERPDVDHIYMDALQMMTGSGGWPLNIVALPDGRPFWGATYVKKNDWIKVLDQLSGLYEKNPEKIEEYAQKLSEGIQAINLVEIKTEAPISMEQLDKAVRKWSQFFDAFLGGYKSAPKFMMPVTLNFLLHYGNAQTDKDILEYVNTTLIKMAWGGIFDQVDGGFSRYSVDTKWHVPHFEKMLYDNGQLISLYSQAYASTKNQLYKEVVDRTIQFVRKELMDASFGFYSSLDADSLNKAGELEEGAYYVWREEELKLLLGDDFPIFKDYYNINAYGHWEHGNYVLIRDATDQEIAEKLSISENTLLKIIKKGQDMMREARSKRSRPRLDDKILTSWNGLMLKGLTDAYRYLGNAEYLSLALKNAEFIHGNLLKDDGGLYHNHKKGASTINGYLEDYATVIEGYIGLYEVTLDEQWLSRSIDLVRYCMAHFYEPQSGMFAFTSDQDAILIRRTIETMDNVIPASNSIMAKNLFKLSKLYPDDEYGAIALQMLKNSKEGMLANTQSHANWLQLALYFNQPFFEIVVVGDAYVSKAKKIAAHYAPNTILAGTQRQSSLSIFLDRYAESQTLIYVCQQGSCKLPVNETKKAMEQIKFGSHD